MKNKKRRTIGYILLSLLLLFASCSSPKAPDYQFAETETETSRTQGVDKSGDSSNYEKILSKRIDKDFGGKSFRIATDNVDHILADQGESLLGKEHYLRNAAIEKKYNIKITLTEESGSPTIADKIRTEALAGTDYCDLILLESTSFHTLAANDALLNVRSIPYLDINADFFYEKSLEATTLGSFSYGIAGDFVYKPEDVKVVFFNKTLLSQAPLPDLYSLVEDNQWDIENLLLYSEEIFSLARENGTDVYGILSTETQEDLVNIFWAAGGMDFLKNDYGTRPELIYNNDATKNFITQFSNTFCRSIAFSSTTIHQSAVTSFASGDSLFLIAPLSTASQLVGCGINWGLVPIPKLDINQKTQYSYTDQGYTLAGFSKGTPDPVFSGIISSAFFATSIGLNQKYAIQTFLNLYLSSPNDANMMKRAIENPYYDPVEFFGQIDPSYTASTQTLLFRSASNGTNFDALYKQYTKMLDKYLDTKF